MAIFKEGDKVSIGENSIGVEIGTVFSVVENLQVKGVWVDVDRKEVMLKYVGKGRRNSFQDFTLLTNHQPTKRFAKGDKVISIKNTPDTEEGFIGFIVRACDGDYDWEVKPLDGGLDKAFNEDELELLSFGKEKFQQLKEEARIIFDGLVDQDHPFNRDDITPQDIAGVSKPDVINSPKHYAVFEQVEAIQVIASSMTQEQFYGYCLGNILKYRLRAGGKDDVMQELGKADKYQELYTEHKHLCKEGK